MTLQNRQLRYPDSKEVKDWQITKCLSSVACLYGTSIMEGRTLDEMQLVFLLPPAMITMLQSMNMVTFNISTIIVFSDVLHEELIEPLFGE